MNYLDRLKNFPGQLKYKSNDNDDILYHYTSVESFQKIIHNESIHLSNIHYMNDSEEYTYGVKFLKNAINELLNDNSILNVFPNRRDIFFENLKKSFKDIITDNLDVKAGNISKIDKKTGFKYSLTKNEYPFVFSLSEAEDDLSQWRAYASNGGVAIGFRKCQIKNKLTKCHYKAEDQRKLTKWLLDIVIELVVNESKNRSDDSLDESSYNHEDGEVSTVYGVAGMIEHDSAIIRAFDSLIPVFKHIAFESEQEWRYTLYARLGDEKVDYKINNQLLKPFINVPLKSLSDGADIGDLIPKIWVGPNNHDKILFKRSFEAFVKKHKCFENCEIEYSKIPYRIS